MLPGKRPFKSNRMTRSITSRFPEWMKIQQEDSVGSRFITAIAGEELDLQGRTLDVYSKYTNIVDCPVDTIKETYQIDIEYPYASGYVVPLDKDGKPMAFVIQAVDTQLNFLSNPTTRLEGAGTIVPSGLTGNITGLEFLYNEPSGIFAVQQEIASITPSSTMFYHVEAVNNNVDTLPFSGNAFGRAYIGLGKNAAYDVLQPEPEWSLRLKYPSGVWITTSGDINTQNPDITYEYSSFINSDDEKVYYQRFLNNPYGSGIYNQADETVDRDPTSGTLKIFDIQNLTTSGTPYEIPSSGLVLYTFTSGNWSYKGFDSPIPWDQTPADIQDNIIAASGSGVAIIPNSGGFVSWRLLPSGGYVDSEVFPYSGTFNWIDGTGNTGNTIRFTNATSKYQAEYEYTAFGDIRHLSSDPKDSYSSVGPTDGTLYFVDAISGWQDVSSSISDSSPLAVKIDPYKVRPGTTVKTVMRVQSQRNVIWEDAKTTNKTVQFIRHNVGYSDDFGKH